MPRTYAAASRKPRVFVTWPPLPMMTPESMGTMGSTHGVNESSSPKPKKLDDGEPEAALEDPRDAGVVTARPGYL